MTIPIGIILGLVALIIIGYPFFKTKPGDRGEDKAQEEAIEGRIREMRQKRDGAAETVEESLCPYCGARCSPENKFCSECGANLTS